MKRFFLTFFLILSALFAVSGQEGPIDLILLLDTSSSMSAAHREVNDYMTGPFLREFLRTGDTFHLIPFAGAPRVDIARRVEGRGDLETIIGRMLLQYPLDPWSDITAALSYAETYVTALPARPKKIVLLSDGDMSPQPGSSSQPLDEAGLQTLIAAAKNRLQGRGITLDYVKVNPGSANTLGILPASGRTPLPRAPAPLSPAGPAVTTGTQAAPGTTAGGTPRPSPGPAAPPSGPPAGGQPSAGPGAPASGQPSANAGTGQGGGYETRSGSPQPDAAGGTQGPETGIPGGRGPADSGPLSPETSPGESLPDSQGPSNSDAGLASDGAAPDSGSEAVSGVQPEAAPPRPPARYDRDSLSLPIIIGLAVLGLIVLGLIIFLVTRRLQSTPNRAMAQAAAARPSSPPPPPEEQAGQFTDHSAALASYAASQQRQRTGPYTHRYQPQSPPPDNYEGPLMLNLFVEDQNTFIGKRNIHAVKPGYSFTVGGGKSDFLIFLVSMPPHIGEVRCDGNRCTFIPRKPQYFPDIGSQQVPDCIGKTIRIISDKKYELHFRFERYEDPLKVLNRLLHSVQLPG
jgi:hypothetical protein